MRFINLSYLLVVFILGSNLYAQNIVQNGDFNATQPGIHNALGPTLHLMDYWNDSDTSMSVNSRCGSLHKSMCSNPNYSRGCPGASGQDFNWPLPYSGLGFAQLAIFVLEPLWLNAIPNDSRISNARNELASPLQKDTTYCTELHVMLMTEPSQVTNMDSLCYTHNGLGMYFSDSAYLPSNRPWDDGIVPQVSGFGYITNDTTWRKLKGKFTAQGGEEYLFIGNYSPLKDSMLQVKFNNCYTPVKWGTLWFDAVYVYNCRDTLFQILQKDTTICFGQPVNLTPQVQGFKLQDSITTYSWHTPNGNYTTTTPNYLATQPGNYWVKATINKRFTAQTNFTVTWLPEPPDSAFLPDSVSLCTGQYQLLRLPKIDGARYMWSNGDTTHQTHISNSGTYSVEITTACWQHTEQFIAYQINCGDRIFIPNAFTPDGDGTNDFFAFQGVPEPITLHIFDRWGQQVYYSANYQNQWDGTYNGEPLPAGVYTYVIEYLYTNRNGQIVNPKGSKRQERGTVSILR